MSKFMLFVPLIFYASGILSGQDCFPDENGSFKFYGNLKIEKVSNDFNEMDLLSLIEQEYESFDQKELKSKIVKVEKSFPTAVTEFLQKAITIYSEDKNLHDLLIPYDKVFGLVEFLCEPEDKLLYEPNDYSNPPWDQHKSHLELVNAKEAYDITRGDPRILIGITDTHIEDTHEDLSGKIDQIVQNSPGNDFHGTHVSGCAAAHTDNDKGISSTGFKSKIVFSSILYSDSEVLQIAQIPGVRVINCSWINNCSHNVTQEILYEEIRDVHNVVVIAGAGNTATHCASNAYVYPAAYNSVISVTSVGHINDVGYMNPTLGGNNWKDCHEERIGDVTSTHHHNDKVNICAPGYNVLSTSPNNSYTGSWGTSFASPMVAGICALVAAVNPCLTASEIQDIVLNSADASIYSIPENSNYTGLLGTGRVDAKAAVNMALEEDRLYIQNQDFYSNSVESSETDLWAGYDVTTALPYGNVIVKTGANVTFEATHKIIFSEGFKVENQATFKAKIYESNCF